MKREISRLVPDVPAWISVFLALAVMLVALAAVSITVVDVTYEGRSERTYARAPVDDGGGALFLYGYGFTGSRLAPVSVTYWEPLSDDAPLPPGVDVRPGPGQAVVSASLENDPDIEREFGPVVGVVSGEGLGSPQERVVYYRPPTGAQMSAQMEPATGYGNASSADPGSELLNVQPAWLLKLFIGLFVLLPSVVLLAVVATSGRGAQSMRLARLELLGATPRLLFRLAFCPVLRAYVLGSAGAVSVLAVACFVDTPLPDYSLYAQDIRSNGLRVFGTLLCALVLCAVYLRLVIRPRQPSASTRPKVKEPRYPGWVAACGATVVVACGILGTQEAAMQSPTATYWFIAGTIVMVCTTPAILGWIIRQISTTMIRTGWAKGRPAMLVAGRDLNVTLRSGVRLASVQAILVFVVTQAAMFNVLGTSEVASAEATFRHVDGRAVQITVPDSATTEQVEQVLTALPDSVSPVLVHTAMRNMDSPDAYFEATLSVGSGELNDLHLETGLSPSTMLPDPLPYFVADADVKVIEGDLVSAAAITDPETIERTIVVIATDHNTVDVVSLKGLVNSVVAPGWTVDIPGEDWRAGAWLRAHQSRWISFTGLVGALVLSIAIWIRALTENREASRRLSTFGAFVGSDSITGRVSGLRIGISTAVGVGIGTLAAWQYSGFVTAGGSGIEPSYGLLIGLILMLVAMSGVIWIFSAFENRRAIDAWRPGKETQ